MGTNEASTLADVRGGAVAGRRTGERGSESSESTDWDGPCWCWWVGIVGGPQFGGCEEGKGSAEGEEICSQGRSLCVVDKISNDRRWMTNGESLIALTKLNL